MFAVRISVDFPFARSRSLSRPASLDLGLLPHPAPKNDTTLSRLLRHHGWVFRKATETGSRVQKPAHVPVSGFTFLK